MQNEGLGSLRKAADRLREAGFGARITLALLMAAALVTAGGLTALHAAASGTPSSSATPTAGAPTPTPTPTPTHCVCRTPSTTVLSVSPTVQLRKSPVQLTANVSCASLPTGTVTFRRRDNTVLGTAQVTFPTATHIGVAELTATTGLPVGKRFIDATYNGNSRCKPSTSALVMLKIVAHCPCMNPSPAPGTPGTEVKVTG